VHKARDKAVLPAGIRKEAVAFGFLREVADPRGRKARRRRGLDGRLHGPGVRVGKHGAHALRHQRKRNRAPDAVARAGNQRCIVLRVEQASESLHLNGARLI
jgi:hypothetical protein